MLGGHITSVWECVQSSFFSTLIISSIWAFLEKIYFTVRIVPPHAKYCFLRVTHHYQSCFQCKSLHVLCARGFFPERERVLLFLSYWTKSSFKSRIETPTISIELNCEIAKDSHPSQKKTANPPHQDYVGVMCSDVINSSWRANNPPTAIKLCIKCF